ncbi:MAG: cysteine protease [Chlorobiaceae bacterium]|nr:cysteine protease [Chlorobiaceae bacterium]
MYPGKILSSVSSNGVEVGTGWLSPIPDMRDYTESHPDIAEIAKKLKIPDTRKKRLVTVPPSVDLRQWCSQVEHQGKLGACTAHAAAGVVEYFQQRAYGKHVESSRRFIYKATRSLMGVSGDTGAWLRNTMGALALCGVPPEQYWPYTDKQPDFDKEPGGFVYAVADNFRALKYFCHDPIGASPAKAEILFGVRTYLAAGIPSMFGFFGFRSFALADTPGAIPMPCPKEAAEWGHAVVAVGYDDAKLIVNTRSGQKSKGALLIRNSWGEEWGEKGYGWLPYDYVLKGFALDFWSLCSLDWVDTSQFGF